MHFGRTKILSLCFGLDLDRERDLGSRCMNDDGEGNSSLKFPEGSGPSKIST